MSNLTELPQIVEILDCVDHGPCDGGATASCPHCGAEGRYVYHFRCSDGSVRGAMKGCIQLFPRHKFARYAQAIVEKQSAKKHLNKWDIEIEKAIHAFLDGSMSERLAESVISSQVSQRKIWMKGRFR